MKTATYLDALIEAYTQQKTILGIRARKFTGIMKDEDYWAVKYQSRARLISKLKIKLYKKV